MIRPKLYTNVFSTKEFIERYKAVDVRTARAVDQKLELFEKNPFDLGLHNHALRDEWAGHQSIDITNDYRAVYKEVYDGEERNAYFVALGTHEELYG